MRKKFPIGYVIGVVWQEQSIKDYNGLGFHGEEKLYEAYRRGRLSGFLPSDLTLKAWLLSNGLGTAPLP